MQENGKDTGDHYKYEKVVPYWISVRIPKNNTILKNDSSKSFKLFTTVK